MGRKHLAGPYKIFDQADVTTDPTSAICNVQNLDKASIAISWATSGISGTITVEARNGKNDSFRQLDFDETISVNADNDYHHIIFNELPFTDIRLKYTNSAGTGTIDAIVFAKTGGA